MMHPNFPITIKSIFANTARSEERHMSLKIRTMTLILAGFLLLNGVAAAANITRSDPTGDVYHVKWTGTIPAYYKEDGKNNIDITELSVKINETHVTMELTVLGEIQNSSCAYLLYFNTTDATYVMRYGEYTTSGEPGSIVLPGENFDWTNIDISMIKNLTGNVTVINNGRTISTVLPLIGSDEKVDLWAVSYEYLADL